MTNSDCAVALSLEQAIIADTSMASEEGSAESLRTINVRLIPISNIEVPAGRRLVCEDTVADLIDSITAVGLLHPLSVREREPAGLFDLVAGLQRLEALRRMGFANVFAIVVASDETLDLVAAIDENVVRHNLSPMELAIAVAARKALLAGRGGSGNDVVPMDRDNLPRSHKATGVGRGVGGGRKSRPDSDRAVAASMRMSEETVRLARKRGETFDEQERSDILGSELDNVPELDALQKLSPEERRAKIAEAKAEASKPAAERKRVSAIADLAPPVLSSTLKELKALWECAPEDVRQEFRTWIGGATHG